MSRVVVDMLLTAFTAPPGVALGGADYVLSLFPFWPRGEPAAFWGLRAKGGFSVNASFDGSAVESPVVLTAVSVLHDAPTSPACILNPWGGGVTHPEHGSIEGGSKATVVCDAVEVPVTWDALGTYFCWEAPTAQSCLISEA